MSQCHVISTLVILGLLAGCGTPPKTAPEVRDYVHAKKMGSGFERFVVQRPYSAVTQTLKKKSSECLDKTFRIIVKTPGAVVGGTQDHGINKYIPISNIGPTRAEFYTKLYHGEKRAANLEQGDVFVFYVADVTPKGPNATTVELYYWTHSQYRWGRDFVKAWARGEDPGCPKLGADY